MCVDYVYEDDVRNIEVDSDSVPETRGEVKADFISEDRRYLRVMKGEEVNTFFEQDEWILCENAYGDIGFVPNSYVNTL